MKIAQRLAPIHYGIWFIIGVVIIYAGAEREFLKQKAFHSGVEQGELKATAKFIHRLSLQELTNYQI